MAGGENGGYPCRSFYWSLKYFNLATVKPTDKNTTQSFGAWAVAYLTHVVSERAAVTQCLKDIPVQQNISIIVLCLLSTESLHFPTVLGAQYKFLIPWVHTARS